MIQPSADRLALLYRLSQTFNSSLNRDEVLNHVIDEVIAAVRAERGFLMLRDATGQLQFHVARGIDQHTIDQPTFQVSRSVIKRVAEEGLPLLTSDAQGDAWLSTQHSVMVLGLRSILCVPLQIKGSPLGVIYVDNRLQSGIFRPDDLDLVAAIAASAATAIENARLYQVAVDKGRLERELQAARAVQTSLLPRETPQLAGWDFAAFWQPARQVSGDFYDFIPLASVEAPRNELGIVIADVSDKGMPAALFMALSRSNIRASVMHSTSAAEAMTRANRLICADSPDYMFLTLFYATVRAGSGEVVYVNAGHNPPYLYRAQEEQPVRLMPTGMLLGITDAAHLAQQAVHLDAGDCLVMYTDGITDALNAQGEEYGQERLQYVCAEHRHDTAEQIVAAVHDRIFEFVGDTLPADDCTLVVAKRL